MSVLLCIPLIWGGFYEFVSAILISTVAIAIIIRSKMSGKIEIELSANSLLMAVIAVCLALSPTFAVDRGSAVIGIVKYMPVLLFYVLWQNLEQQEKAYIWKFIPISGAVIVCISCLSYPITGLRDYFFRADRLGGFFQYSNTFALYLLIGIILLQYREKLKKYEITTLGILLFGIVITGSRSVFILLVINVIFFFFYKKKWRAFYIKGIGIVGIAAVIAGAVTGQLETITRLFQISTHSSTLLGRILYWQDALPLIKEHPFGLGYLGYYYLQPQIQTGDYIVKYIHNDWLQIALDIGIIAIVAMLVLVIKNIISKKNIGCNRHILLLIALHCCLDFDIEFISIALIGVMCLELGNAKKLMCKQQIMYGAGAVIALVGTYFTIALGSTYFEEYHLANQMYPYNTLSLESEMHNETDEKKQAQLADKIMKQNGNRISAYEINMKLDLEAEDYQQMLIDGRKMLDYAGFDMEYYERYVVALSKGLDQTLNQEDMENAQMLLEEIQGIPERINQLKERTSPLAYEIVDVPDFTMDESVEAYIENLSEITLYE